MLSSCVSMYVKEDRAISASNGLLHVNSLAIICQNCASDRIHDDSKQSAGAIMRVVYLHLPGLFALYFPSNDILAFFPFLALFLPPSLSLSLSLSLFLWLFIAASAFIEAERETQVKKFQWKRTCTPRSDARTADCCVPTLLRSQSARSDDHQRVVLLTYLLSATATPFLRVLILSVATRDGNF